MPKSLGQIIKEERVRLGITQKELAGKIKKREDDKSIAPQYLNDIEKDRRTPPPYITKQIAKHLRIEGYADYLAFLSGSLPDDILNSKPTKETVSAAYRVFRKPRGKVS